MSIVLIPGPRLIISILQLPAVSDIMANKKDQITVQASSTDPESGPPSQSRPPAKQDASVVVTTASAQEASGSGSGEGETPAVGDQVDQQKKGFLAYFKTKEFYITLVLGWVCCNS